MAAIESGCEMAIYIIDDDRKEPIFPPHWSLWTIKRPPLASSDVLVVNAHALVRGERTRSACGGLLELEEILADPMHDPAGVAVVSFQSWEDLQVQCEVLQPNDLVPITQWPLRLTELEALTNRARPLTETRKVEWWLLRLAVSSKRLQLINRGYSHAQKSKSAAMRLFLAALQLGQVKKAKARKVLQQLAPDAKEEILNNIRKHRQILEKLKPLSSQISRLYGQTRGNVAPQRKKLYEAHIEPRSASKSRVLMIDDGCFDDGWKLILGALSDRGAPTITLKPDWETGKAELEAPEKYDLVLLDCSLGKDRASGLELLAPIRQHTRDLPVVIMTSHDNAELALTALRNGCNDFFAKELTDPRDRNPLDYYLRFAEVIQRKGWERKLRKLWRKFESALPAKPDWEEDEANIRYAFYLLFSLADGVAWWARESPASATHQDVEQWVAQATVLSISAGENIVAEESKFGRVIGIVLGVLHARSASPKTISITDALDVLQDSVNKFSAQGGSKRSPPEKGGSKSSSPEKQWSAPSWPQDCRLPRDALRSGENLSRPSGLRLPRSLSHVQRGSLGAAQFVLGATLLHGANANLDESELDAFFAEASGDINGCLAKFRAKYVTRLPGPGFEHMPSIALIDDEGLQNGWELAVEMVLGWKVECHRTLDSFLKSLTYGHPAGVLLDLHLPAPEDGLGALRQLKTRDPGLPVIMFSAATDTVNALRALRTGALDYIPKWLPHEERGDQWKQFTELLVSRLQAAAELGQQDVRRIWRNLHAHCFDGGASPLEAKRDLLTGVRNWRGEDPHAIVCDIRRRFYQWLLPGFTLYMTQLSAGLDALPAVDVWRYQHVLGELDDAGVNDAVTLVAGRAVEYLGQLRWGLENGALPGVDRWKNLGNLRQWIAKASRHAAQAWDFRNHVKWPASRPTPDWRPNATEALEKAAAALEDFEQKGADEAGVIQKVRSQTAQTP